MSGLNAVEGGDCMAIVVEADVLEVSEDIFSVGNFLYRLWFQDKLGDRTFSTLQEALFLSIQNVLSAID